MQNLTLFSTQERQLVGLEFQQSYDGSWPLCGAQHNGHERSVAVGRTGGPLGNCCATGESMAAEYVSAIRTRRRGPVLRQNHNCQSRAGATTLIGQLRSG